MRNKKLIAFILAIGVVGIFGTAKALPTVGTYTRTLVPEASSTYDVGSSTQPYRNAYFGNIRLNGLSGNGTVCIQVDNTGTITTSTGACAGATFTTTTITVGGTTLSKTAYTIATSGQSGAFFTTDGVSQIIFNMATATVFVPGFLSPVDFTTFNNKQDALNGVYVISLGGATGTIGLVQNLTMSGNNLNTIQDITTTSSPTFASTTLTGQLNVGTFADFPGISNPPDPANGFVRLHGDTTQGITRLEVADQCGFHNIINRDNYFVAKNVSGSVMATGTIVYQVGNTGAVPNVDRAMANVTTTMPAIGFAENQVANNGFGCFMNYGVFTPFDTSAFTSADSIYLSPTASGTYQRARPTTPNLVQRIGSILNSGVTNGSVLVTIAPAELGRETGTISPTFNINGVNALTVSAATATITTATTSLLNFNDGTHLSTAYKETGFTMLNVTTTASSAISNVALKQFYGTFTLATLDCVTSGANVSFWVFVRSSTTLTTNGTTTLSGITCTSSGVSTSTFTNADFGPNNYLAFASTSVSNATTSLDVSLRYKER